MYPHGGSSFCVEAEPSSLFSDLSLKAFLTMSKVKAVRYTKWYAKGKPHCLRPDFKATDVASRGAISRQS